MAQLTITIPDAQVPRVQAALEETLEISSATAEDVRQFLIEKLVQVVRASEKRVASRSASDAVTDITPS